MYDCEKTITEFDKISIDRYAYAVVKIDEYLAAGKPIVATTTDAMEMFREYTFLCRSKEEYVTNVQKILQDPSWSSAEEKRRRRDFALTHTWENSVGAMGNAFYYHLAKQHPVLEL